MNDRKEEGVEMPERRKLFLVCALTSILILLFGVCFSKNAGENIINDLISARELNKEYLSGEGWFYDYSSLDAHHVATGLFIIGFYLCRYLRENSKRFAILLLCLYVAAELIIMAKFLSFAMMIGLPMLFICFTAAATFKFCR